jgi:acetyl esterase/lipase
MSADTPRRSVTAIVVVGVLLATIAVAVTRAIPAQAQMRVEHGTVWRTVDGEQLRLDAFLPGGPVEQRPAVVLLHGGGWSGGDRSEMRDTGRRLADAGYAAFSVDYRLAPEFPYPAAVEDGRAAVEWLRAPEQVARYGLDPARIGALGSSAGGQLVGMLATTGRGPLDSGARIRAAVSWSGPMLFWPLDRLQDASANRRTLGWWKDSVATYLGCEIYPRCTRIAEEASPLNHVDAGDTPMLLANSTDDFVPATEATTMGRVLDAVGVRYTVVLVRGNKHASLLGDRIWDRTLAFLDEQLGPVG